MCIRDSAYLVWDDAESQGRYFVIDAKGDKTTELVEITEDYKLSLIHI